MCAGRRVRRCAGRWGAARRRSRAMPRRCAARSGRPDAQLMLGPVLVMSTSMLRASSATIVTSVLYSPAVSAAISIRSPFPSAAIRPASRVRKRFQPRSRIPSKRSVRAIRLSPLAVQQRAAVTLLRGADNSCQAHRADTATSPGCEPFVTGSRHSAHARAGGPHRENLVDRQTSGFLEPSALAVRYSNQVRARSAPTRDTAPSHDSSRLATHARSVSA